VSLVGVRKVNLVSCELEEELDQNGFRHRGAAVGPRLEATRIGAGVYEAYAGIPIWPYHYHYGVEEWLYVLSGAPVLRDPGGRRELAPGDLVAFPSGHLGAHTVAGPGRFVIFSTQVEPPVMSVYPDSDKLSIAPVRWGGEPWDRMMAPRDAGVDYWYGEGDQGRFERAEVARQPDTAPSPPVANALRDDGQLGTWLDRPLLDLTTIELVPGAAPEPYQYEIGRELWVLALTGTATVRTPAGEAALEPGEVLAFGEGPAGAHQLSNRGDEPARVMVLSTTGWPAGTCFPDTDRWLLRPSPGEELLLGPDPAG
jgi:uncharacterized cupin superfamily protein